MPDQKVIFLDIDGVLNSVRYDRERFAEDGNIDLSRLPLLKSIVSETGAVIVLSSSWRKHWDADAAKRDPVGQALECVFTENGVKLYDKTPELGDRSEEISRWLCDHPEVTRYVIIDDTFGGWGTHAPFLVKTDSRIGRGLEARHVNSAIEILNEGD